MKILVTGANGFIAKNLIVVLLELGYDVLKYSHSNSIGELTQLVLQADFIFHTAGVNRPQDTAEFYVGNSDLTKKICDILKSHNKKTPVVYTSSIQAEYDNDYGKSKKIAEDALFDLASKSGNLVYIYRLANVFGKWCRPNYNSAVATFCHNITHDLPIEIRDSTYKLQLLYIDDVVVSFINCINKEVNTGMVYLDPYEITLGDLATHLYKFKDSRDNGVIEKVGNGLVRALYATYISYYAPDKFSYSLVQHADNRGVFVEMLKTKNSGQFSFFTAYPEVTRGGHYHHTKNEKFLVIKGKARFGFKHIITGEYYEKFTDESQPEVVETIPGWAHDITNIGDDLMVVMLWANEIFDKHHPDTVTYPIEASK